MKIIATIHGCGQIGIDLWQNFSKSYIFDSSESIDKMLGKAGVETLDELNLSEVKGETNE